ncbi:MAG: hypothetical protein WCG87_01585 [Bacteroidota bacterium]
MRSSLIIYTLLITVLLNASCSKSNKSIKTLDILGHWKFTQLSVDSNLNGIDDPNEILPADTSWNHELYTFKPNGTMLYTRYDSVVQNYLWALLKDNTILQLAVSNNAGSASTFEYVMHSFTDSTMIWELPNAHLAYHYYFKKQ